MAGRCFNLCSLLRRKRKKGGPEAAPAPHLEELQHFQPLQQDPGQDRTEGQDRARGRFRRAVRTFLKFVGIQRRRHTTTPPDVMAKPDMAPTKPTLGPDVSTVPSDPRENCNMAVNDGKAIFDMVPTDGTAISDMGLNDAMAYSEIKPTAGTTISDMGLKDCTATCDNILISDSTNLDISPTDVMVNVDIAPVQCTENPDTALADDRTNSETTQPEDMANADTTTESSRNLDSMPVKNLTDSSKVDFFKDKGVYSPKQVPAIVRYIHQCLTCHVSPEGRLHTDILRLAGAHPHDVVMSLLRCAPLCDRAAAVMWRTIASLWTAVEKVLPTLLRVMEDWPSHSMSTSDGDDADVFALAATLALWMIIQEPKCQDALIIYAPRLLVALLCQVFLSTEQMPEEVSTFWSQCREQHSLPTNPNRFAVQTIEALLCRLQWDSEVVAVQRKCGWDTLLCADTHHYAVGLLAREMRQVLVPYYAPIAENLLELLGREELRWELPALAFLVEILDYLDVQNDHDSVLQILSRHLRSECPENQRLALRGLVALTVDPSMAQSICSLSGCLLELLRDGDGDVVRMTLFVFLNVLHYEDIQGLSSTAPRLAEALLPLFDHDNRPVQLLSVRLFREVLELVAEEGREALETHVHQSLVPLFLRCHDEQERVAEASLETLLCAARFLRRRDLEQLLRRKQPWQFCDRLMEKDVSHRAQHLRRALPYLQSPQEPLREAAVRFMGLAGWHSRDLQPLREALHILSPDDCPSFSAITAALLDTFRCAVMQDSSPPRQPWS